MHLSCLRLFWGTPQIVTPQNNNSRARRWTNETIEGFDTICVLISSWKNGWMLRGTMPHTNHIMSSNYDYVFMQSKACTSRPGSAAHATPHNQVVIILMMITMPDFHVHLVHPTRCSFKLFSLMWDQDTSTKVIWNIFQEHVHLSRKKILKWIF